MWQIRELSLSMTSRKSSGESGSPWGRPWACQILSPGTPLSITFMLSMDSMTPYAASPQEEIKCMRYIHLEEERRLRLGRI
jgi:hypothetical protein